MRRLLIFLLLLPLPLVSQVKILMPVVVKDAAGKPVTDLKQSDFQVSGPKNISIDRMWLVPPQTVSEQDTGVPVTVLYDAADAANPNPDPRAKWIRAFLGEVAKHGAPVAFYIYTADGLKLIYDPATSPQILTAALALVEKREVTSNNPKIEEQAKKIDLVSTSTPVHTFRFDNTSNAMGGLIAVARLLPPSDKRKVVIWLTSGGYDTLLNPDLRYSPAKAWYSPWQLMQEAVMEQFNAAHISAYPLDPDVNYDNPFTSAEQLALCTGGRMFNNASMWNAPMWDDVQEVLADFGPYYTLAVAVPTPKETGWIPVKIKVNRPGLTVRAAPGFYGLKPEKASKAQAAHP